VAEILKSRQPTASEPIRKSAAAPFYPLQQALPGEAEQVAINGAAIKRQTKATPQFIRGEESFGFCESHQDFVFCHFIQREMPTVTPVSAPASV